MIALARERDCFSAADKVNQIHTYIHFFLALLKFSARAQAAERRECVEKFGSEELIITLIAPSVTWSER